MDQAAIHGQMGRASRAADRENERSPAVVQRGRAIRVAGGGGGNAWKVFRIVSNATGNGTYNCYEQVLDDADWDLATPTDKMDDLNSTNVVVYNLAENGMSGHSLAAGDLLVAGQWADDASNDRWLGFPAAYKMIHA